ncbi:MAG: Ni/Fe-hydrogenase cytochrome b subunit [bacterium]|nr:Ni/Fe-hydrogenase cytochrome b subunit [bacterium]
MRVKIFKSILWFFIGMGTITGLARFINGLGATTNLTDTTPWGLWIGFDVMGGVALAAGGFVVAASVYIFRLNSFKPILRAAVLTAFLGYLAVAVGLLFDLGLPWNIWHMIFFWNPHSPLFEVGWCVMLYLTVLFMEFAPVWLEKTKYKKLLELIKKVTIPLVILGVMLSTLHQSSLGSLMLIMPFRINPLWYSPIIPILFFISAVGLGLMMVTLESLVTSWLYYKKPEIDILQKLGKAAVYVLSLYIIVKIGDLVYQGNIARVFDGTWESTTFIFELLISALLPAILLSVPQVRNSKQGLLSCALMVVLGFVFNRINISGIATIGSTGTDYFPSLIEMSISLWVVSAAVLIFLFFVENFKVWEKEAGKDKGTLRAPVFDNSSFVWKSEDLFGALKRYSLMFISGIIIAFAFLPEEARHGAVPVDTPVERARIDQVFLIDGNRSDHAVVFDHEKHKENNGNTESCVLCHHMNKPLSENSSCADCHKDMFLEKDIFDHEKHLDFMDAENECKKCHTDPDKPKTVDNVIDCLECHTNMESVGSFVEISSNRRFNPAPGYKDAMHGLCIECHETKKDEPGRPPRFAECSTCHRDLPSEIESRLDILYRRKVNN